MSAKYIVSSKSEQDAASKKSYRRWSGKTLRMAISFMLFVVFGGMVLVPAFARDAAVDSMDFSSAADASSTRCAPIGHGMNSLPVGIVDFNTVPHADASNRKWNIREAYNTGTGHIAYTGEPAGDESGWNPANWFLNQSFGAPGEDDVPTRYQEASNIYGIDNLDGDAVADMEETRGFWRCTVGGIGLVLIPDLMLSFSSIITGFASLVADLAFSTNFICQNPQNPSGVCLNLIGIIGGTGGNAGDGIIGSLTSSIFFPLSILGVAIAGITLLWTGIVKREYRKAWTQLAWVLGAFIIFAALLTQPLSLARAPMIVMNNIASCIVGAFNGINCMSSSSVNQPIAEDEVMTGTECLTHSPSVNNDELMSMIVSGLTCNIYMAFVLEPWANNSFGVSWNQLNMNNDNIQEALGATGLSENDFRVCMLKSGSNSNLTSGFGATGGSMGGLGAIYAMLSTSSEAFDCDGRDSYVQNLGAYQLALGAIPEHNAADGARPYSQASSLSAIHQDLRWYKVAAVVNASQSTNANMWNDWTGRFGSRLTTGFLAIIASGLGSFVIVLTAFWALIFYVGAVLLITFAPLFFLFGIHPTRGKKIFLGWLEMLFSTILKYIASALFLIIAISFYAAVLGASTGFVSAFLFILLITFALILYRKEIIDLLSRVNMGGEQLSHNSTQQMWNKAKEWGGGMVGSGVGRAVADSDDISQTFKEKGIASGLLAAGTSLTHGAGEGNKRFLRNQRTGVLGMAGEGVREYDSASNQNRSDRNAQREAYGADMAQDRTEAQNAAEAAQKTFDADNPGETNEQALSEYNAVADERGQYVDDNGYEREMTREEANQMLDNRAAQEAGVQQQTMQQLMNNPDISDEDKQNLAERHNLNNKIAGQQEEREALEDSIREKEARLQELMANGAPEEEINALQADIDADKEALAGIEDELNINIASRDDAHGRISEGAQNQYQITFAENARAAGFNFSEFPEHFDVDGRNRFGELGLLSEEDRINHYQTTDELGQAKKEYDKNTKDSNKNISDYIDAQSEKVWHEAYQQNMDAQKLAWKQQNGNKEISPRTWREMQNSAKSFADSERALKNQALWDEHGSKMAGNDLASGPATGSDLTNGYSAVQAPPVAVDAGMGASAVAGAAARAVSTNPMMDAATGRYTTDRGEILNRMGGDWNDADASRSRLAQEYQFDQMKANGDIPAHTKFNPMAAENLIARDESELDPNEMAGLNKVKNNVQGRIDDAGLNITADDYIDYKNGEKSIDDLGVSEADLANAGVWQDQNKSFRDAINDSKDAKTYAAEQAQAANLPESTRLSNQGAEELSMNKKEHAYRQQNGDIPKTEPFDENAAEYLMKRDPNTLTSEQRDLMDLYKRDIQTKIDEGFANLDGDMLPEQDFTADDYAKIQRGEAKPEEFGLTRDVLQSMNLEDATKGQSNESGRIVGSSPQQQELSGRDGGSSDDGGNNDAGGSGTPPRNPSSPDSSSGGGAAKSATTPSGSLPDLSGSGSEPPKSTTGSMEEARRSPRTETSSASASGGNAERERGTTEMRTESLRNNPNPKTSSAASSASTSAKESPASNSGQGAEQRQRQSGSTSSGSSPARSPRPPRNSGQNPSASSASSPSLPSFDDDDSTESSFGNSRSSRASDRGQGSGRAARRREQGGTPGPRASVAGSENQTRHNVTRNSESNVGRDSRRSQRSRRGNEGNNEASHSNNESGESRDSSQ